MLTTMLPREVRRDRALRALGGFSMVIGAGAVIAALALGPWDVQSLDDILAAHVPQRIVLGVAGLVLAIVGWVLRGSGSPQ
jgi:hypothetical protein